MHYLWMKYNNDLLVLLFDLLSAHIDIVFLRARQPSPIFFWSYRQRLHIQSIILLKFSPRFRISILKKKPETLRTIEIQANLAIVSKIWIKPVYKVISNCNLMTNNINQGLSSILVNPLKANLQKPVCIYIEEKIWAMLFPLLAWTN